MWSNFSSRWLRKKRLDSEQLLHSEWNRRLGIFSLAGIGGVLSLATVLFLILPRVFSVGSIAPPLPSVLIFITVHFFVAKQLSSIARILPRNCLIYELAYSTHSESLAFILGWTQLIDALSFTAILAKSLCEHICLLFKSAIHGYLKSTNSELDTSYLENFDIFPIALILIGAGIMCCSLRVLATVTLVLLISALFTVTSTTVVAVLHNIQQLRITSLGFPYNYEQISAEIHWLFLGILCLECFSHVSEETEQPRKTLPRMFPLISKTSAALLIGAMFAYFPFTQKLHFHEKVLLPNVFNSISIYSARYLLSVGAVCALSGSLLVSFLPSSRLLCAMTRDRLILFPIKLLKLHGKGGSPRCSILCCAFLSACLVIVPRDFLLSMLPISICMRIFCQSLLVYRICFTPDKIGLQRGATKYNRLRRNVSEFEDASEALDDGYSCISSEEPDQDDEILTHICEINNRQNSEWISMLDTVENGYQNYLSEIEQNHNHLNSASRDKHDCFQSSCGEYQISGEIQGKLRASARYHIYESEFENNPFHCQRLNGQEPEPFANPEIAKKLSMKYLRVFVAFTMLSAIAYKTLRESE
uniref:Amino acid permease/ SLC12A domain-containing protein n=1 Tax=Panagrolaimus sp. ES5 TaxID=591445 RepID=A0AC34GQ60_9BILA